MKKIKVSWLICALLLLFWLRLQATAVTQAATFDEILHILHGALLWQSWQIYGVVQNPPLINGLIGLPVHLLLSPPIPFDHPIWQSGDWLRISQQFAWQDTAVGLQLIWVGRQAIIGLSLLTAALVYRFTRQLFASSRAGLLALLLYTLDPNIVAHSVLATTDLGTAFFFLLAVWAVWRSWQHGRGYGWTAVALGCALAAKFSGLILLIALLMMAVYRLATAVASTRPALARQLGWQLGGWLLLAVLLFLAAYRFQWAPLTDDFVAQQIHQTTGHDAFFHGEIKRGGWWYYFPALLLIKTPLPTLFLWGFGLMLGLWQRRWQQWPVVWPLLVAGGVLAAGLTSQVNIGYRYLLPMLPLLFVLTAGLVNQWLEQAPHGRGWRQTAVALPLLALLASSLAIHPHYLAYFNATIGGPKNGWQWAVDSNLDWGQDLQLLADYIDQQQLSHFYAAWLGSAPLTAYGMDQAELLPVWPMASENIMWDTYLPESPLAGVYVLSATQLQGVYARDASRFAWFRQQEPSARVGYSLFVYQLPAYGRVTDVALSGIGLAHVALTDQQQTWQSNQLFPRWFDGRSSFVWPADRADGQRWTAVGDGHLPQHPLLQQLYPPDGPTFTGQNELDGQRWRYHLYADLQPPQPAQPAPTTAVFGQSVQFLGYEVDCAAERPLDLLTYWQIVQPPRQELKLFVHILDENGQLLAQHDGLDVRLTGLQTGDQLAQLHTTSLANGRYQIRLGVYQTDSLQRLPVWLDGNQSDALLFEISC